MKKKRKKSRIKNSGATAMPRRAQSKGRGPAEGPTEHAASLARTPVQQSQCFTKRMPMKARMRAMTM